MSALEYNEITGNTFLTKKKKNKIKINKKIWICCLLIQKKSIFSILAGLDGAGKTTILYRLKLGEVVTHIPTIG